MPTSELESDTSRRVRHAAGIAGLASLPIALVANLLDYSFLAGTALLVFLAVPFLTFIVHISLTNCLTKAEKRVWHAEMSPAHRSIVALWSYLFTADLKARTKGFAPYKGGFDGAV